MNDLGHDWPRPMPEDWRTEAACRTTDPTVFFDERQGTRALAICAACPVRSDCLQDALTLPRNEDQGIRGGMTQRQRHRLHPQLNPRRPAECGTASGYDRHRRNHTAVCDECSEARSEYARKLRLRRS